MTSSPKGTISFTWGMNCEMPKHSLFSINERIDPRA